MRCRADNRGSSAVKHTVIRWHCKYTNLFRDNNKVTQEIFQTFLGSRKCLKIKAVFLWIFLEFSQKIAIFQWLKLQNGIFQAIKGVKRGFFPLFPSEYAPPVLRSEGAPDLKTPRNMQWCGSAAKVRNRRRIGRRSRSVAYLSALHGR